jgi:hypothetical protein
MKSEDSVLNALVSDINDEESFSKGYKC